MSREAGFLAALFGVSLWCKLSVAVPVSQSEVSVEPGTRPAASSTSGQGAKLGVEPERIALLTEHLDRATYIAAVEPYLPAIGGTLCAAGTAALATADTNEIHLSRTAMLMPTTLCAAASFGSYLLPREYQWRVTLFSMVTSLSALAIMDVVTSPDVSPASQVTFVSFVSGNASSSALLLLDAFLERPVSWTTLANDEAELRALGTGVSRAEVQRIEGDYRRYTVLKIPRWIFGATLLVSAAVAITPAFISSTSHDDKVLALGLGGVNLGLGALDLSLALTTDNQYQRYEKGLAKLHLSPIGPRGASGLWATMSF